MFYCFHNPSNSDMDYRIFNLRTNVNACDCTRQCTDTVRESALKVDSGIKKKKKKFLPHQPASAACRADNLPTELYILIIIIIIITVMKYTDSAQLYTMTRIFLVPVPLTLRKCGCVYTASWDQHDFFFSDLVTELRTGHFREKAIAQCQADGWS